MRDIVLTLFIFGSLPLILRKPWYGLLFWTWLSLMSPGRLTWGFAYTMPFGQLVAIATLVGILISKEPKTIPWRPLTVVWAMFVVWMCITTVFALNPGGALVEWDRMIKIQLFCFLTLMLCNSQKRLMEFVWVIFISIGFYGTKGGIFTILTGGSYLVWGPADSFIGGNNELAFALIVIIPLIRFLQMHAEKKWISRALGVSMILCMASAIGSQSRGAFLAILAMCFFLVLKSRKRAVLFLVILLGLPVGLSMMPQEYWDRMDTIQTYEKDPSAMGRINAWTFAWNLVGEYPVTGGGFRTFTRSLFGVYAPDPDDFHDVHSIYFEVLGEQGWPGFILYMTLAFMAYGYAGWTARRARGDPELEWHADLARMAQVCLVGYAVGGAFLGLAYFDLYYDIVAIILLNRLILERRLAGRPLSDNKARLQIPTAQTGAALPGYGRLGGS